MDSNGTGEASYVSLDETNEDIPLVMEADPTVEPKKEFWHPLRAPLRYLILFLVCSTILGSYYSYDSIGVIATELMEHLEISQAEYGLLYSVYSAPNIILPLFGGFFLDKVGVRIGLSVFLGLVTLGTLVVASAPYAPGLDAYHVMLFGRFVFGLGAESSYVAQDTFCFIWFQGKNLALSLGLLAAAGRFSEIFTFNTMATISNAFGDFKMSLWFAFLISLVATIIGLMACFLDKAAEDRMRRENIPRLKEEHNNNARLSDIFNFPITFWLCSGVLMTFYSTIYPFISFASDFIQIKWGWEEEESGRIVSILSFTSMLMAPIMGYVLDKVGKRLWAVNVGNVILVVACLILGLTDLFPAVSVLMMGAAYSLVPAAIWPSLALIIEEKNFGTAYGLALGTANLGLLPTYWAVGRLIDETHAITHSLILLSCLAGSGIILGILWQIFDYKAGSPCNSVYTEDMQAAKRKKKEHPSYGG